MVNQIRKKICYLLSHAISNIYCDSILIDGEINSNGFYYDFHLDHRISKKELKTIEEEIKKLMKININIQKIKKDKAVQLFHDNLFKKKLLQNKDEVLVGYQEDFFNIYENQEDVYVEEDSFILDNISEVQWNGQIVQRIQGFAFENNEKLEEFLELWDKNKSIDHKNLGQKMDLFYFDPLAMGMCFWKKDGLKLFNIIKEYIRSKWEDKYEEVNTPALLKRELWEKTGHLSKYSDNMFCTENLCLKPMNCPAHVLLFKHQTRSYRELPLRIAEFGGCFRKEEIGGLNGLKRGRFLTQDDGHIFCTMEQVKQEVKDFLSMTFDIYKDFGMTNYKLVLATRPPKRIGSDELWDKGEKSLEEAMEGLSFEIAPEEGAFYGPKIEIHLQDNLGRLWQCGTIQIDFFIANNLDAKYIDSNAEEQMPIVLHKASLGSIERFIAILLENYEGNLPFWIMPIQIMILPNSQKNINLAKKLAEKLEFRCEIDYSMQHINKRIKRANYRKIPIIMIVGDKEEETMVFSLKYKNKLYDVKFEEINSFIRTNNN